VSSQVFTQDHFTCHPGGCGAVPGEHCTEDGRPADGVHDARQDAYRRWLDTAPGHPGYMDPAVFQARERRPAGPG
jgi:hypothetical protein